MAIWRVAPVELVPEVILSNWRILETDVGTRHFVGVNVLEGGGRVSSAITEFDPVARRGRTRSGRVYELIGSGAYNSDAEYVWQQWRAINNVTSYIDVSDATISGARDDNAG
jgi:hypothetical protein